MQYIQLIVAFNSGNKFTYNLQFAIVGLSSMDFIRIDVTTQKWRR